jgi:hypothetical protein
VPLDKVFIAVVEADACLDAMQRRVLRGEHEDAPQAGFLHAS